MSKARQKGTKKCTGCKRAKDLSEFYVDRRPNSVIGYKSRCKVCISEAGAAKRLANRVSFVPSARPDGFKPGFGVNSHLLGLVGEAKFITFAARNNWQIFRGLAGHEPYDYVVDTGEALLRVEVKFTDTPKKRHGTAGDTDYVIVTKLKADPSRYDYLFVGTPKGDYWIPVSHCPKDSFSTTAVSRTRHDKWETFRVEV